MKRWNLEARRASEEERRPEERRDGSQGVRSPRCLDTAAWRVSSSLARRAPWRPASHFLPPRVSRVAIGFVYVNARALQTSVVPKEFDVAAFGPPGSLGACRFRQAAARPGLELLAHLL